MNNKKDISDLKKKLIGCDHVALLHAFASELIDMLASERQQSAERAPTQWAYDQACAALHAQRERAEKAEAEIAALKGDQAPVGIWRIQEVTGEEGEISRTEFLSVADGVSIPKDAKLFTAPQKLVVSLHPTCYFYGNEYLNKRATIAAIEAAGGIVKGEK